MNLLSLAIPLLEGASSLVLRLSKQKGHVVVLVEPHMLNIDQNTTDEGRAALQAALSRPFKLVVPEGGDPDAALAEALSKLAAERAPNVTSLSTYIEAQRSAASVAKQTSKTGKGDKGAKGATGTAVPPPADADDSGDSESAAEGSKPPVGADPDAGPAESDTSIFD